MSLDQILLLPPGYGFDSSNVAPTITVPGAQTIAYETQTTISGISIADADGNNQTFTISVLHGTLALASSAGLTGGGDGTNTLTYSGALSVVNTRLSGLKYTPDTSYSGSDTMTVSSTDSAGGVAVQKTIAITVTSSLLVSLIAYWKMENVNDSHTNGYTLTNNNTATFVTGKANNCVNIVRASSQYLSIASNSNLQCGDVDWTWAGWAKVAASVDQYVVSKDAAGSREYSIVYRPGTGKITLSLNADAITVADTVSTGTWFFFVCWHDAANDLIGMQVNNGTAVTASTGGAVPATGSTVLQFGRRPYVGFPDNLDGSIDEIAMWKRLLTTNEKTQLYNSGTGVTYPAFA